MDIKKDLPFAHCDSCPEFMLDVEEQVLFSEKNSYRELVVRCKNDTLCKRLKEQTDAVDGKH